MHSQTLTPHALTHTSTRRYVRRWVIILQRRKCEHVTFSLSLCILTLSAGPRVRVCMWVSECIWDSICFYRLSSLLSLSADSQSISLNYLTLLTFCWHSLLSNFTNNALFLISVNINKLLSLLILSTMNLWVCVCCICMLVCAFVCMRVCLWVSE